MQEKLSKKRKEIVPRGDEYYCAAYMLAREQGVKNTRVGPANRRCLVERQRGYERKRDISEVPPKVNEERARARVRIEP